MPKINKTPDGVTMRGTSAALVRKALRKVEGVKQIEVDMERRLITVGHTEDVDKDKMLEALREYGFQVAEE